MALRAKGLLADLRGDVLSISQGQCFEDSFDAESAAMQVRVYLRSYLACVDALIADCEEYQDWRRKMNEDA